ncbi:hypothetical protein ACZ90_09145 [Streptomyces albus subsp. albus]|nr:hypothetical protein ACZ90_09145 [Streptomyces albus subsp. albus]
MVEVDDDPGCGGSTLSITQSLGLGQSLSRRRPPGLLLARSPVGEIRQDSTLKRDDMTGVTDDLAGPARSLPMTGDHGPARRDDVQVVLAEPMQNTNVTSCQSRRHRIVVSVEGHQTLRAHDPLDFQFGRVGA